MTYKSRTAEATSNDAAKSDAAEKGKKTGEKLAFERRLADGAALVDLGTDAAGKDAAKVMDAFRADPAVASVEPDVRAYPMAITPNDTDYAKQWDLFEPTGGMNVPGAWDTTTGSGVTVAVIDTGYAAHSDLAANTVAGYDFISDSADARDGNGRDGDPADEGDWNATDNECGFGSRASSSSWHGTHVAGTIAAVTDNAKGIAGVAYGSKVQHVRVLGKCGGSSADIADAITWASGGSVPGIPANATPAKVINLSLGGASSTCPTVYRNAINGAVSAAPPSSSRPATATPTRPASPPRTARTSSPWRPPAARATAPTTPTTARPSTSPPPVARPAAPRTPRAPSPPRERHPLHAELRHHRPGRESYKPYQGTSMAAPHIAGLAALMKSAGALADPRRHRVRDQGQRPAAARDLLRRLRRRHRGRHQDRERRHRRRLHPGTGTTFTNTANVTISDGATATSRSASPA